MSWYSLQAFIIKLPFRSVMSVVTLFFRVQQACHIPSDTKLLLTKNYSEIIIFGKIANLTRNSLKMSLFPGHFERTKCLKNYEK